MSKKNRAKEYYINNKDIILNRAKEYYINNKESIREDPKIKDYEVTATGFEPTTT